MLNKRFAIAIFAAVMIVGVGAVALAAGGGSIVTSPDPNYPSTGHAELSFSGVDLSDNAVDGCDEIIWVWWDANGTVFDVDDDCTTTGLESSDGDWGGGGRNTKSWPTAYPFTVTAFDIQHGATCNEGPDNDTDEEQAPCEALFRSGALTCIAEGYFTSASPGEDDYGDPITPLPINPEPFRFCGAATGSISPGVAMINDDRNNSFDLAAPMAIYCPAGLPHFYGINPDGSGYFIFNVSQQEIDAVGIPEVNTIIKEKWGFQLWRLTTGEYQGVSPRDPEGKIYNVIYNICLPDAETKSWFSS